MTREMNQTPKTNILVLNCGGSSIKYKLLNMQIDKEVVVAEGSVQGLGTKERGLVEHRIDGCRQIALEKEVESHEKGIEIIIHYLQTSSGLDKRDDLCINLVAHKVTHGGDTVGPVELIDSRVRSAIERMAVVASVHNPPILRVIKEIDRIAPQIPQIAVFETGFHGTIPDYARTYGLPYDLAEKYSLKKFGFHGASHRFISQEAPRFLGLDSSSLKLISVHLGSGTSVAAIKNGYSIDVSSGYTPQSGTIMSTRAGDFDPEILYFLLQQEVVSLDELRDILNNQSGLRGISGIPVGDMRDIEEAAIQGNPRAKLAVDTFCYSVKKYIGAFIMALEGVDVLSFTGGIGENSPSIREQICSGLEWMNLKLNKEKNLSCQNYRVISDDSSSITVVVIPANEEVIVARQALGYWNNKASSL